MGDMDKQSFQEFEPAEAPAGNAPATDAGDNATQPIGVILEIAGSGSQIALDLERLNECMDD
jgi:uncharacterized protein